MNKYFINKDEKTDWCTDPCDKKKHVPFPMCLALQYHDSVPFICADFLLNTAKKILFVKTETPLPVGSKVVLHFYIPPDKKLLGEFKGKVTGLHRPGSQVKGNYIKIYDLIHLKLDKLEKYLEDKRHLVDVKA